VLFTGRLTIGLSVVLCATTAVADNWPEWRGPEATGVSTEKNLPTHWSAEDNVAWKAPLEGLGTSSPVVWGDQVFLTTQMGVGPVDHRGAQFPGAPFARDYRRDDGKVQFVVYAFDRSDGHQRWRYELTAEGDLPAVHYKHSLASPSPVTDGESVYAWVGTGQLVALNMKGELLWQRHLGREYAPFDILWGHGSSPVLYENLLYLLCDHPARAYLLALDKRTGKEIWKVERGSGLRSYSTPFILRSEGGDELVVNSSHRLESLDPKTGALLWYAGEPTPLAIPMPVWHDGILYVSRGYSSGPYASVQGGGRGDVSSSHVRWSFPTGAPYVSSLVYYQGLVYMANENGIVTAIDAETGANVWRERVGGVFTASPIAADGKIYLLEESGRTVVLEAGRTFSIVATNALGERSLASPAVSDGHIFIRTDRHLYCIGKPSR
jgi:outer membrane protein assembly factor BamB